MPTLCTLRDPICDICRCLSTACARDCLTRERPPHFPSVYSVARVARPGDVTDPRTIICGHAEFFRGAADAHDATERERHAPLSERRAPADSMAHMWRTMWRVWSGHIYARPAEHFCGEGVKHRVSLDGAPPIVI